MGLNSAESASADLTSFPARGLSQELRSLHRMALSSAIARAGASRHLPPKPGKDLSDVTKTVPLHDAPQLLKGFIQGFEAPKDWRKTKTPIHERFESLGSLFDLDPAKPNFFCKRRRQTESWRDRLDRIIKAELFLRYDPVL